MVKFVVEERNGDGRLLKTAVSVYDQTRNWMMGRFNKDMMSVSYLSTNSHQISINHRWTSECDISSSPLESAVAVNEICGGRKSSSKG